MKSRFDFGTDEQYKEYLRHYYAVQILASITTKDYQGKSYIEHVNNSILRADELIKQLKINEK